MPCVFNSRSIFHERDNPTISSDGTSANTAIIWAVEMPTVANGMVYVAGYKEWALGHQYVCECDL